MRYGLPHYEKRRGRLAASLRQKVLAISSTKHRSVVDALPVELGSTSSLRDAPRDPLLNDLGRELLRIASQEIESLRSGLAQLLSLEC
jgi:hypothetical protein